MLILVGLLILPVCFATDSSVCDPNCVVPVINETEHCNVTTGECLYGCKPGYAGPNCSVECPATCASSNISEVCEATSRECLFGCQDGYYGAQCENRCNDSITYCKICTIQSNNSVACDECLGNFYKYNEECKQCSGTCKDICDRDKGHCMTGCKNQTHCGPTCGLTCSDGCASHDCEQSCTCRLGCTRKKWGDKCDKFCNVNCNEPPDLKSNICERSNGSCSYKCKNNTFWGSQCDKQCSSRCNGGTCEQTTGNCTGDCNSKKMYGIGCDKACNKNCINGTCERADGYCDSGCVTGSYGERCQLKCNEHCKNHTCGRANGYCLNGCTEGWRGQRCDIKCNDNCFSGTCEQQRGYCTFGCVTGWYGNLCSKPCSDRCRSFVCSREDGDCVHGFLDEEGGFDFTNIKQVAILGSGWLLSLVLVVVLIVIAIRRHRKDKVCCNKRSAKDNQREMTGTMDRLQQTYMTLEKGYSFSKTPDMYLALNKDKVCKHGNNLTEENQRGNRIQNDYTAKETENIYDLPDIETEYLNLKIGEGNTSVFAKEMIYVDLEK